MSVPYAHRGSIIVVVMVIMTFLAATIITTFIATHQLCSLAQSRCQYQQKHALLEGLLHAGAAYCCDNRVKLFSSDKEDRKITLSFDPCPCQELADKLGRFKGSVTIHARKKKATIEAHLSNDKLTKSCSCAVALWDDTVPVKKDSKLRISNWTVDA